MTLGGWRRQNCTQSISHKRTELHWWTEHRGSARRRRSAGSTPGRRRPQDVLAVTKCNCSSSFDFVGQLTTVAQHARHLYLTHAAPRPCHSHRAAAATRERAKPSLRSLDCSSVMQSCGKWLSGFSVFFTTLLILLYFHFSFLSFSLLYCYFNWFEFVYECFSIARQHTHDIEMGFLFVCPIIIRCVGMIVHIDKDFQFLTRASF